MLAILNIDHGRFISKFLLPPLLQPTTALVLVTYFLLRELLHKPPKFPELEEWKNRSIHFSVCTQWNNVQQSK